MSLFICHTAYCNDRHVEPENLKLGPRNEVMTIVLELTGSGNTLDIKTEDVIKEIFERMTKKDFK